MRRFALVVVLASLAFALARAEAPRLSAYIQGIPGSPVAVDMAPVPFRGDAPGFWIERHEVTQAEYEAFLVAAGRHGQRPVSEPLPSPALSSFPDVSQPFGGAAARADVVQVTRAEAVAYAAWMSVQTGRTYRLPTEAEWEQACRAGEDEGKPLELRAWFVANAGARPHPLGTRAADRLGLFDMLGNLHEWTIEAASAAGGRAALKGGSWADAADDVGCAGRRLPAGETAGFRVLRPYDDRAR